jgi:GDPmannose 4,6-dehydratase
MDGDIEWGPEFPKLRLGNIDSFRDWSYIGDIADGLDRMLHHDIPDDFVLASGKAVKVRDFLKLCFDHIGEKWEDWVEIDQKLFRPAEVDFLRGDARKARKELGWKSTVDVKGLAHLMVDSDLKIQGKRAHRTGWYGYTVLGDAQIEPGLADKLEFK